MNTIKKISLLAVLSTLFVLPVKAQQWQQSNQDPVTLGVKGGLNFANYNGDAIDGDYITRGNAGIFLNYKVNEYFSVQPEANLTWTGAKNVGVPDGSENVIEGDIKQTFIQIPVLAKFELPTRSAIKPNIFVGPAVSFSVDDEYDFGNTEFNPDANTTQFGVQFGAGVEVGNIMIDGRYHWGLTDAFDNVDAQNSVFMVSVGFGI